MAADMMRDHGRLPNLVCDGQGRFAVVGLRGEVWMAEVLDNGGGELPKYRRKMLGDFELAYQNTPMHIDVVVLEGETFVVAGVLKQTQRAVKIWHLEQRADDNLNSLKENSDKPSENGFCGGFTTREIELEKPREGKVRGLGAVLPIHKTEDGKFVLRLACGIGIGKAHIWDVTIDIKNYSASQRHVCSVMGRRNSISAMYMCPQTKKLVTVAALDELVQVWDIGGFLASHGTESTEPFNASSKLGIVESPAALECAFSAKSVSYWHQYHATFNLPQPKVCREIYANTKSSLLLWHLAIPSFSEVESVESNQTDDEFWDKLGDYEGDLNELMQPHGYGWRSIDGIDGISSEQPHSYSGHWKHGQCHGYGILRNEATGEEVYKGHWRFNKKHGLGQEVLSKEEYNGYFDRGLRHGFGTLRLTKSQKASGLQTVNRESGEAYAGFWKDGLKHGIGRWTFPPRCKSLNVQSPTALLQLGKIGCTVVHRKGELLRELLFHRVDGELLTPEDRALIECGTSMLRNASLMKPGAFADNPDGSWPECEVCWACMESLSRGTIHCTSCEVKLHKRCAAQPFVKPVLTATSESEELCPMPACKGTRLQEANPTSRNSKERSFRVWVQDYRGAGTKGGKNGLLKVTATSRGPKASLHPPGLTQSEKLNQLDSNNKRPASDMNPERQKGVNAARKLARRLKKDRLKLHSEFAYSELIEHRRCEMLQRKQWSAQLGEAEASMKSLQQQLDREQHAHLSAQLQLNRFHGRDLKSMKLSELTELQDAIEDALQNCRLAMETATFS